MTPRKRRAYRAACCTLLILSPAIQILTNGQNIPLIILSIGIFYGAVVVLIEIEHKKTSELNGNITYGPASETHTEDACRHSHIQRPHHPLTFQK